MDIIPSKVEAITHSELSDMPDVSGLNTDHDAQYLKLDQTTPQKVVSGSPQFDEGLTIKSDKKLYLDGL